MAVIRPFKAIRPSRDKVHLVASRSYVSYSKKDLSEKLDNNPYTFLHIIHPDEKADPGSRAFLRKIKARYEEFRDKNYLIKDEKTSLYIYEQKKEGHVYRGLIGCASIDDYLDGTIKKHEETLEKRERKLKHYLDVVDINAEPVCFSYPDNPVLEKIMEKYACERPEYEFVTTDKVSHRLWIIEDNADQDAVVNAFKETKALYIADGHHRTASSARFGDDKRKKDDNYTGNEAYNFFMGYFLPESQLSIYGFHRLVKDLGNMNREDFLSRLLEDFEIEILDPAFKEPAEKNHIHLYFGNNEWFRIIPKKGRIEGQSIAEKLDANIVSEYILKPVLGIEDLRRDNRVNFAGGSDGFEEMIRKVDEGEFAMGIALFPVSAKDLRAVADAGEVMPPKTTWIEPKLRSGLTIYSLSEK